MAKNKAVATISADELLELQKRAEIFSSEKLVIVTGPGFGTVVRFLMLGAALGAAGVLLFQNKASQEAEQSIQTAANERRSFASRAQSVLGRAQDLASRARDAAHIVAEAARPAIEDAVAHGRTTADQTRRELESDISKEEA